MLLYSSSVNEHICEGGPGRQMLCLFPPTVIIHAEHGCNSTSNRTNPDILTRLRKSSFSHLLSSLTKEPSTSHSVEKAQRGKELGRGHCTFSRVRDSGRSSCTVKAMSSPLLPPSDSWEYINQS